MPVVFTDTADRDSGIVKCALAIVKGVVLSGGNRADRNDLHHVGDQDCLVVSLDAIILELENGAVVSLEKRVLKTNDSGRWRRLQFPITPASLEPCGSTKARRCRKRSCDCSAWRATEQSIPRFLESSDFKIE